jgi:enterochelin esterase-like enzyme
MKRLLIVLAAVMPLLAYGLENNSRNVLSASRIETVNFFSESLKTNMRMNIYLPAGYNKSIRYPVLYMIHGYNYDESLFYPTLRMHSKADELIKKGRIKPLIIVSPDIKNSFGINTTDRDLTMADLSEGFHKGNYEDYLIKDVIRYIDGRYSTFQNRENRYIGGISMGGFVALHLSFKHPELFTKAGGHSPAIITGDPDNGSWKWIYSDPEVRKKRDPIAIAGNNDLQGLKVYLDCGNEDIHYSEGCSKLETILRSKHIEVENHANNGDHSLDYWMGHIEDYLLFYGS